METDEARITSIGSFERPFTKLQNGPGFCYEFLIDWVSNTNKHVDDNNKHVDENSLKFKGKQVAQIEIEAKLIHMGSWKFTWTNAKTCCFRIFYSEIE